MKLNTATYSLPAYWASYLINGDDSGLDADEQAHCDQFCTDKGLGGALDCSDEHSFSRYHDAQYLTGNLAGDVLDFTFPILSSEPYGDLDDEAETGDPTPDTTCMNHSDAAI